MTDPLLTGLAAGAPGASDEAGGQGPSWVAVRATANYSSRGETVHRDHVYLVDATDPFVQEKLRHGWIVPIPADEQPKEARDAD